MYVQSHGGKHFLDLNYGSILIFQKECNAEQLVKYFNSKSLHTKVERKMRFKGLHTFGDYLYIDKFSQVTKNIFKI